MYREKLTGPVLKFPARMERSSNYLKGDFPDGESLQRLGMSAIKEFDPVQGRSSRNRCRLASDGLSVVLAPSIVAQEPGQAKDRCRGANSHPTNGERESLLGRSQNSR